VKIAIIGNSNSIMKASYAEVLRAHEGFTVDNFSIGGSPNIVVLETVLTVDLAEYDYIVIETAVVDALQGPPGIYPSDIALRNLRLGLQCIRSVSSAKLILLLLPTRVGMLEPENQTTEAAHLKVAEEVCVSVLNVFRLFREWIGGYLPERIQELSAWAPVVAEAFDLPRTVAYDLSWSAMRKEKNAANLFAISGFLDHAHITRAVHRLIGNIITGWIMRDHIKERIPAQQKATTLARLLEPEGAGCRSIVRESSLMRRSLLQLSDGESMTFRCPPGYIAIGVLFNRSKTSGYVELKSAAGSVVLDCRFFPYPAPWIAVLVPIIDCIGGGDVTLTMKRQRGDDLPYRRPADTGDMPCTGVAEVGEMIVIRDDAAAQLGESNCFEAQSEYLDIADCDWANSLCVEAHQAATGLTEGLPEISTSITKGLEPLLVDTVRSEGRLSSLKDRARLLLLMGLPHHAFHLLSETVVIEEQKASIPELKRKLGSFLASLRT
jgi:hypothetical protein